MTKKKIFKIIIILLIIILVFCIILKLSTKKVIFKEYENDIEYFVDLNNDSKEEKIKFKNYEDKKTENSIGFPTNVSYSIIIDDKEYNYKLKDSRYNYHFYITDINDDGIKEIVARINDNTWEFNYMEDSIYNFKNDELNFVKKVKAGDEVMYNFITKTVYFTKTYAIGYNKVSKERGFYQF